MFEGTGDSVHDFMADANGRVSVVVPRGQVNAAFAELTGINVARGVGLLITRNDERAEIRCGRGSVRRAATARCARQNVVFDTTDVKITGQGEVRLGPEELDLSIKGEPKKLRLARAAHAGRDQRPPAQAPDRRRCRQDGEAGRRGCGARCGADARGGAAGLHRSGAGEGRKLRGAAGNREESPRPKPPPKRSEPARPQVICAGFCASFRRRTSRGFASCR